jgi:hypothetical protein
VEAAPAKIGPVLPKALDPDLPIRRLYTSGPTKVLSLLTIAALHQGNNATIPNYLERELRYMDAGE